MRKRAPHLDRARRGVAPIAAPRAKAAAVRGVLPEGNDEPHDQRIGSTLQSFFEAMGEWDEVQRMTEAKLAKTDKPLTRGGPDRRGKVCRCHGCGIETVCTPTFDFYTRGRASRGFLYCFPCLCEVEGHPGRRCVPKGRN
jgi:hypothetical protein